MNICTLGRCHRLRNEIKPLQSKNVIEPNGARKPHRRPQQLPEWLASGRGQAHRIYPGKSPALTARVELVRWRADFQRAQDQVLIVPGIESVRTHADRKIEIETDRQCGALRLVPAGSELLVRDPLDEFEISQFRGMRRLQALQHLRAGGAPLRRPFPPWRVELSAKQLECGIK